MADNAVKKTSSIASSKTFTGRTRPTHGKKAEELLFDLLGLLETDWKAIRSTNLGVVSGTSVVSELMLRRVRAKAAELHMLTVSHPEASERIATLLGSNRVRCLRKEVPGQILASGSSSSLNAPKVTPEQVKNLRVMLDMTGHEDLSDYLRHCVDTFSDSIDDALRRLNRKKKRAPPPPPKPVTPTRVHNPLHDDLDSLRFGALLPDRHRLLNASLQLLEERDAHEKQQLLNKLQRAEVRQRRQEELDEQRRRREEELLARRNARGLNIEQEIISEELAFKLAIMNRHKQVEEIPYEIDDVVARWRATCATGSERLAGGGPDSPVMVSSPLPLYGVPPSHVRVRMEMQQQKPLLPSYGNRHVASSFASGTGGGGGGSFAGIGTIGGGMGGLGTGGIAPGNIGGAGTASVNFASGASFALNASPLAMQFNPSSTPK
mmetsp:Transcript_8107/g.15702  ORF Transcript_8107/g.15702 Transcript_8107/m.15702 type:complete len:435 (-) Transcript_8107:152-1456(-)|eukprot:CAMPEP_0175051456 /NCGR_PEP_ID=MMETSP0052_2-20121109/7812_1 /TAXON_ID=51329 ORGANISM="Polytomella parva, Strain SAG 63-3" /NCGR_SAMPLE_ID=MMETSP0052_2 /ASSEMBLY_ACC=CAM_ASM_000194 /LENGTH=434 /DNA_ID=CAMNT_0016315747 /DNA_START=86 /DNA_END=1390 /DNA_ORIENTATION=-